MASMRYTQNIARYSSQRSLERSRGIGYSSRDITSRRRQCVIGRIQRSCNPGEKGRNGKERRADWLTDKRSRNRSMVRHIFTIEGVLDLSANRGFRCCYCCVEGFFRFRVKYNTYVYTLISLVIVLAQQYTQFSCSNPIITSTESALSLTKSDYLSTVTFTRHLTAVSWCLRRRDYGRDPRVYIPLSFSLSLSLNYRHSPVSIWNCISMSISTWKVLCVCSRVAQVVSNSK